PSDARDDQQRGSACGQMQKISAGKFYFEPPFTSLNHLVGAAGYGLFVFMPPGQTNAAAAPRSTKSACVNSANSFRCHADAGIGDGELDPTACRCRATSP